MWSGRIVQCTKLTQRQCQKYPEYIARRHFKVKKSSKKRVPPTDKALEHFDTYYRPVYRDRWPSIRVALLSARKTAAVINKFSDADRFSDELQDLGADNIVLKALHRQRCVKGTWVTETLAPLVTAPDDMEGNDELKYEKYSDIDDSTGVAPFQDDSYKDTDNGSPEDNQKLTYQSLDTDRQDVDIFVPTKSVYSQSQSLRLEESKRSVYTPSNMKIDIIPPQMIHIPEDLKVFSFPKGNISRFPEPSLDVKGGFLSFYLMDAASILPVVALNISAGDRVLDLCAAPGGKSLSILQTGLPELLHCNDLSGSRIARLLNILQYHVPEEVRSNVTVTRRHGSMFTQPQFDKVLVDVPCSTDRHSLLEEDNNLFSPSRISERLELPGVQKELLKAGIQACVAGGSVVYSTCTLAPSQNDGVVQQAVEESWQQTGSEIVVEDLSNITDWFQDTFTFHPDCRLGQLVVPSLTDNFGPMYFSKLNKIS